MRPRLDIFYLDRIDQVHSFSDRSFHGLVTFSRLAAWGLDPIPTTENLGHKETNRRSRCRPLPSFLFFYFKPKFVFFAIGIATMKENKEKAVTSGDEDVQVQDDTTPSVVQKPAAQTGKRKTISSSVNLGDLPSRQGSKK